MTDSTWPPTCLPVSNDGSHGYSRGLVATRYKRETEKKSNGPSDKHPQTHLSFTRPPPTPPLPSVVFISRVLQTFHSPTAQPLDTKSRRRVSARDLHASVLPPRRLATGQPNVEISVFRQALKFERLTPFMGPVRPTSDPRPEVSHRPPPSGVRDWPGPPPEVCYSAYKSVPGRAGAARPITALCPIERTHPCLFPISSFKINFILLVKLSQKSAALAFIRERHSDSFHLGKEKDQTLSPLDESPLRVWLGRLNGIHAESCLWAFPGIY
ncbi:hypothetical protein SKAU_G00402810 [Synaphobranchus kaupii]|uniref:Uncharacterized protein n=1 Tax=Synaphobranchus kaupii TaxID=118154 RepID=A0A9Q1E9G6_SYNKA|nr:hypothetical protein SKAU_G00402810 [Synaphobranchus kaupii]